MADERHEWRRADPAAPVQPPTRPSPTTPGLMLEQGLELVMFGDGTALIQRSRRSRRRLVLNFALAIEAAAFLGLLAGRFIHVG